MTSNIVTISCIVSNCTSTTKTYDYQIKVINLALEEFWVDVDGSGVNGTKFNF